MLAVKTIPTHWELEIILPFREAQFRSTLGADTDLALATGHSDNAPAAEADAYTAALESIGSRDATLTRVLEVDCETVSEAGAYERLSRMLVSNIDVLVVLWDGAEQDIARDGSVLHTPIKAGGTAWTAHEAVRAGAIVVWIDTALGAPPRLLLPSIELDRLFSVEEVDCRYGPLRKALSQLLMPTEGDASAHDRKAEGLRPFLTERPHAKTWHVMYAALESLVTRHWHGLPMPIAAGKLGSVEHSDAGNASAIKVQPLDQTLLGILQPRFAALDALATYYAHTYRSSYVLAFLLSGIAVVMGLLGQFWHEPESALNAKAVFAIIELLLIGAIIEIVWSGRRKSAYERWLNYRGLAETLRHQGFLSKIGALGATHGPFADATKRSWMLWYTRATIRELGLPAGVLTNEYCWALLEHTRTQELAQQSRYHRQNAVKLKHLHDLLHGSGTILFFVTALSLLFYIIPWIALKCGFAGPVGGDAALIDYLETIKPVVTILAAGLPALGAAFAGIRVQGDFEGFSLRSERTATEIDQLSQLFEKAELRADLQTTTELLIEAARVMSEDLSAWQALYGRKELVFPA